MEIMVVFMNIKKGYIFTIVMVMLVGYMVLSTVLSVRSSEITSSHISEKLKSQNMRAITALLSENYIGRMINQSFYYAVAKLNDYSIKHPIPNPDCSSSNGKKMSDEDIEACQNTYVLSQIKHVFLYGNVTYTSKTGTPSVYADSIHSIQSSFNRTLNYMGLTLKTFNVSNVNVNLESNGYKLRYYLSLDLSVADSSGRMSLKRTYDLSGDASFTGMVDPAISRNFKKQYDRVCSGDNPPDACKEFSYSNGYLDKVYLFQDRSSLPNPASPKVVLGNGSETQFNINSWWYGPVVVYDSSNYYTLIASGENLGSYTLFIDGCTKVKNEPLNLENIGSFGHIVKFTYNRVCGPGHKNSGYNYRNNLVTLSKGMGQIIVNESVEIQDSGTSDGDFVSAHYYQELPKCGGYYGAKGAKCALISPKAMYDIENMRDMMVCQYYFKDTRGPSVLQRMMENAYNKSSKDYGLASIIVGDFMGANIDDRGNDYRPIFKDKSSRIDVDLFNPSPKKQPLVKIVGMAGMKNPEMAKDSGKTSTGHFYVSKDTEKTYNWNKLEYNKNNEFEK